MKVYSINIRSECHNVQHYVFLLSMFFFISTVTIYAQSPQKMTYQSVVRGASGDLLTNTTVGIQVSILQGSVNGTNVYTESYSPIPQTNINGLLNIAIGEGTPSIGVFTDIDWANGPYFIRVRIDPLGGTNYTILGTSQLLSVPYAFYSEISGNSWDIRGNEGTSNTDFIGTTDNQPLKFKVNNTDFGLLDYGSESIFFGTNAGNSVLGSGVINIGIGSNALDNISTGDLNIGLGQNSLQENTSGGYNIAIGSACLDTNMTGNNNIAIGKDALSANLVSDNIGIGNQALSDNNTGTYNTAIGNNTLEIATDGEFNTAIGYSALSQVESGWNNTGLGRGAQVPDPHASHQVRIGNTQVTLIEGQVSLSISSDKKWKESIRSLSYGLEVVSQLKPVYYVRKNNEAKTREIGFIAQDVEVLLTKIGYTDQGLLAKDSKGGLSLRYNDFIPLLTKAIQELDTNNKSLQKMNMELVKRIEKLEERK